MHRMQERMHRVLGLTPRFLKHTIRSYLLVLGSAKPTDELSRVSFNTIVPWEVGGLTEMSYAYVVRVTFY